MNSVLDKKDYGQILQNLKEKIRQTRLRNMSVGRKRKDK